MALVLGAPAHAPAAAAPAPAPDRTDTFEVDVNVVGLYIPGQPFPRPLTTQDHTGAPVETDFPSRRIKNVAVKPLLFSGIGPDQTVRQLFAQVLGSQHMAPTREWLDSAIAENAGVDREHYFEAYVRRIKTITPQFRLTVEDNEGHQHRRFTYEKIDWVSVLNDVRCDDAWVHIVFAIWQPRPASQLFQPVPIITAIRGMIPGLEQLQGEGAIVDERLRWPVSQPGGFDYANFLAAAAEIIKDSLIWDLEVLLMYEVRSDDGWRKKLEGFWEHAQNVANMIREQISLPELIAVKIYTLSLWAVCIDQDHHRPISAQGDKLPTLAHLKQSGCPRCHLTSDFHSFFRLKPYLAYKESFDRSLMKFQLKKRMLYRGMSVQSERYECRRVVPQLDGVCADPREEIVLNRTLQRLARTGKCRCFPFHACDGTVLGATEVGISTSACSFSTDAHYAESNYSRFAFKPRGINDWECGCECAQCRSTVRPNTACTITTIISAIASQIMRRLGAFENEEDAFPDVHDQLLGVGMPEQEALQLAVALRNEVESEMVKSGVCSRGEENELLPGHYCRGTVLQFEDHARDIDVISATKFTSGVREKEVVIDEGFQFVVHRSEIVEVRRGNTAHIFTRMILQPLLDINAATPSQLMTLPGMFQHRSAVKFFEKRRNRPGSKFETWRDVEKCAQKIHLGCQPYAKTQIISPSESWRGLVSFGFTEVRHDDSCPGAHHELMDRVAARSRLAHLFDSLRPAHESWGGWLFSHTNRQVTTFFDLASDVNLKLFEAKATQYDDNTIQMMKKEHLLETAEDLDARYLDCQVKRQMFHVNPRERYAMLACILQSTLTSAHPISPDMKKHGKEAPATTDSPWLDDKHSQNSDPAWYQDDVFSVDCAFEDVIQRMRSLELSLPDGVGVPDEDGIPAPRMPPVTGRLSVWGHLSSPRILRMAGLMLCGLDASSKQKLWAAMAHERHWFGMSDIWAHWTPGERLRYLISQFSVVEHILKTDLSNERQPSHSHQIGCVQGRGLAVHAHCPSVSDPPEDDATCCRCSVTLERVIRHASAGSAYEARGLDDRAVAAICLHFGVSEVGSPSLRPLLKTCGLTDLYDDRHNIGGILTRITNSLSSMAARCDDMAAGSGRMATGGGSNAGGTGS